MLFNSMFFVSAKFHQNAKISFFLKRIFCSKIFIFKIVKFQEILILGKLSSHLDFAFSLVEIFQLVF